MPECRGLSQTILAFSVRIISSDITLSGKTGTAQEDEKRPNHALFVGYAPADAPQIAIATRIAYGYGSSNACVFVDQVMKYYFKQNTEEELLNGKATNVGTSSNSFGD